MIEALATFLTCVGLAWLAVLSFFEWAKTPRIVYLKPVRSRRQKLFSYVVCPLWTTAVIVGAVVFL